MLDEPGATVNLMKSSRSAVREIKAILIDENIPVYYQTALTEILDDKVKCKDSTGKIVEYDADTVLIAVGMRPLTELAASMRHCAPETEVFVVGDAKEVGTINTAVNEAFQKALHI